MGKGYFATMRAAHPVQVGDRIDGELVVTTWWEGEYPMYKVWEDSTERLYTGKGVSHTRREQVIVNGDTARSATQIRVTPGLAGLKPLELYRVREAVETLMAEFGYKLDSYGAEAECFHLEFRKE